MAMRGTVLLEKEDKKQKQIKTKLLSWMSLFSI